MKIWNFRGGLDYGHIRGGPSSSASTEARRKCPFLRAVKSSPSLPGPEPCDSLVLAMVLLRMSGLDRSGSVYNGTLLE